MSGVQDCIGPDHGSKDGDCDALTEGEGFTEREEGKAMDPKEATQADRGTETGVEDVSCGVGTLDGESGHEAREEGQPEHQGCSSNRSDGGTFTLHSR